MSPTFSIVIPLHNKERYIVETVQTVLAQSEADWELLVVDNNSTDDGPRHVRELADPRLTVMTCNPPGVSAARNAGARRATGEWLVFLDADDLLAPNYLRSQRAVADGADLVICPYVEFIDGSSGQEKVKHPASSTPTWERLVDPAIVFAPGPPHAFMVRHAFLRPELDWPEGLDRLLGEDTVYWFRLVHEARVAFNPQPVARYRYCTPEGRLTTLSDPARLFHGLHAATEENLRYLAGRGQTFTPGQAENLMRFYAAVYLDARRQGDRDTREKALAQARLWQQRHFAICPQPTLPIRLRRYLGVPFFTQIFRHA